MVLAIDFDDVVHNPNNKNRGYRMGIPESGAILSMQRLSQSGHRLWIFTARDVSHTNQKKAVADWLDYFHIPYYGITNIKLSEFELIIDNRCLNFTNWASIMAKLRQLDVRE